MSLEEIPVEIRRVFPRESAHAVAEGFAVGVLADEGGVEDIGRVGREGGHSARRAYGSTLFISVVPSLHCHIIAGVHGP